MSFGDRTKRAFGKNPRTWLVATAALAVAVATGLVVALGAASGSTSNEPTNLEQALDAVLVAGGMDGAGFVARTPVGAREEVTPRVLLERERPFGGVAADEPPRIALVFDDLGYATDGLAAQLLALDAPLTFAVLPDLPKSDEFADAARARGHEVLLHLAMEPLDLAGHDPGRSALFASLPSEENARRLGTQLGGLRRYDGVSNHMGSRATASPEVVDLVLAEMKRRDRSLFFLDSRTTPFSVVPERARRAGVPVLCNNLFLDGGDEEPALPAVQTERLESIARRRGQAIGIGHVRPATVAAVREAVERWRAEGFRLVRLSDLKQR